jgi:hypothetical protein
MVELGTGAVFEAGSKFWLSNVSTMSITSGGDFEFTTNRVSGTGRMEHKGSGVIVISGDNSKFSGYYFQERGVTSVTAGGVYFTGISSIVGGSSLVFAGGGVMTGGGVELWSAGAMVLATDGDMELSSGV